MAELRGARRILGPGAGEVNGVLTVCEASAEERLALIDSERLENLKDFIHLTNRDVNELAARLERRSRADGKIIIPAKIIKNIQALCFWARENNRKEIPLRGADFTEAVLISTLETMQTREDGRTEAPAIKPEKFDPDKWPSWSKQFVTYLSHVTGQQFAPLDYVLREEPAPMPIEEMNERDRALYGYPLQGRHYNLDNMTTYRLLSDLVSGTSGYTWISDFDRAQNGREAWLALVEHYEGGGQREKRMSAAVATIKALHYKNESVFSFEDFSRKLIQAYRDLDGTDEEMTDFNKVKTLLEKVQITLPRAEVAKAHVRQHFRQDIHGAIEYLGTEFADMFADAISFKRGRARSVSAVDRPAQRARNNETEPHQTPDGITTFFGVDVTDVARTFTSQEMTTLGPRGQAYIFQERERLGVARSTGRGGRGGRGRGGRGGNSNRRVAVADAVTVDDVSGITQDTSATNGRVPPGGEKPQAPKQPTTTGQHSGGNRGSQNGSGFGAGAYST